MPKFSENNAIKILKSFSRKELRAFERYFKRLYPEKEVALEVFCLLKKYHKKFYPNFPENYLTREKVAKKLYGNYENRLKKLNENLFELSEKFREFLLWQEIKDNTFERDILECQIFERRNMPNFSNNLIKKMETRLPEKVGLDYHFERFRLTWRQLEFLRHDRSQVGSDLLQEFFYQSDIFYFGLKSNLFCTAISRERVLNHTFNYTLLKNLFEAKSELNFLNETEYINIYATLFELMQEPDESIFSDIFEYYQKVYPLFGTHEQSEIFSILQNIIGSFSFALEKKGAKMYHNLYKFGLSTGIILNGGGISAGIFLNIINASCKLKEIEWMEKFISTYKIYLPEALRLDVINLSEMRLYFEKQDYKKVILKMGNKTMGDGNIKVIANAIRLQAIYELHGKDDIEEVKKAIVNFKRFIKRNESIISKRNVASHSNFVKFLEFILNGEVAKFKQEGKKVICAYFSWLHEKAKG